MAEQAGSAYVSVRPDFSGFHRTIARELRRSLDPEVEPLGRSVGRDLTTSIRKNLGEVSPKVKADTSDARRNLRDVSRQVDRLDSRDPTVDVDVDVDRGGVARKFAAVGTQAGSTMGGSVTRSLGGSLRGAASSPVVIGAVGALAAALTGPIATAVSAGLVVGVGGGLTAVALAATHSLAEVQSAIDGFVSHVVSTTGRIAAPFEDTWAAILASARSAFDSLVPMLSGVFARMAPAVSQFAADFGASLSGLQGGISAMGEAFNATLDTIGRQAPDIMSAVNQAFALVAGSIQRNQEAVALVVKIFTELIRVLGIVLAVLTELTGVAARFGQSLIQGILAPLRLLVEGLHAAGLVSDQFAANFAEVATSAEEFGVTGGHAAVAADSLGSSMANTARQAKLLQNQLDLTNARVTAFDDTVSLTTGPLIALDQATIQYRNSLARLTQSVKDNGTSMKLHTAEGRKNRTALIEVAQAANAETRAMVRNGASVNEVSDRVREHRSTLIAEMVQMGINEDRAEKLANRYLLTPSDIRTTFHALVQQAISGILGLAAQIAGIPRNIYITAHYRREQMAAGHLPAAPYASGGLVGGQGTSTSDSVPIRASVGEFVVRAAAVRKYGVGLMRSLNAGQATPDSGFANGGLVGAGISQAIASEPPLVLTDAQFRNLNTSMRGHDGITVENLHVHAFSDRFSLKQVQDDLAFRGVT